MAINVESFFQQKHNLITVQYINKNLEIERANAKKINTFFKEAKKLINESRGKNSDNIFTYINKEAFKKEVQEVLKGNKSHQQLKTILYKAGGSAGEMNVATVIQAFMNSMVQKSNKQFSSQKLMTGTQTKAVDRVLTSQVNEQINNLFGILESNIYADYRANTARAIKTDIDVEKGNYPKLKVRIKREPTVQEDLYNILRTAKISVKNYTENSYYSTTMLTLGNTKMTKVFLALVNAFGFNFLSGIEKVQKNWNDRFKENEIINKHIYHLRFLYELTGIGLEGRPVDYLLFNTPDSDKIEVRSVKDIVSKIFEEDYGAPRGAWFNPFFDYSIKLSKEYFDKF